MIVVAAVAITVLASSGNTRGSRERAVIVAAATGGGGGARNSIADNSSNDRIMLLGLDLGAHRAGRGGGCHECVRHDERAAGGRRAKLHKGGCALIGQNLTPEFIKGFRCLRRAEMC